MAHLVQPLSQSSSAICAREMEWNNKDPFFDRDLINFQALHHGEPRGRGRVPLVTIVGVELARSVADGLRKATGDSHMIDGLMRYLATSSWWLAHVTSCRPCVKSQPRTMRDTPRQIFGNKIYLR